MKNTSWLYYTKKESAPKLTSKETGQIDVSAYLNGQPKFFVDNESAKKIPKKIIIGELDLRALDKTDAFKFFFVLNELCRTGFEICIPTNGYLEYTEFFKFMCTHTDIKKAGNVNISVELPPSEQYFTLNTEKARELAHLFDSLNPDIPYHKELLNHFLKSCFKRSPDDPDDSDDEEDEASISNALAELIKNPIEYIEGRQEKPQNDPKAIIISPHMRLNKFGARETLEAYTLKKGVRSIEANCHQSEENLKWLERLILLQPVTELMLIPHEASILRLRGHQHLKYIYVSGDDPIPNEFLRNIPQKLNKLTLSGDILPRELIETNISIDSLELGYMEKTEPSSIIKLINSVHHLHHLKLSYIGKLDEIFGRPLNTLDQLRCLKVSNTNTQLVNDIISHAPNLEHLDIYSDSEMIFSSEQELTLPRLKSISITTEPFTQPMLEYFLRVAPNLEKLRIPYVPNGVKIPDGIKLTTTKYLPDLKHESVTQSLYPQAPTHRPEDMQKPSQQSSGFDSDQHAYAQGVIIKQLQRYAKIKKETPDETLSVLKKGICFSLSEYFHDVGPDEIKQFFEIARDWEGSIPIPGALESHFDKLYPLVDAYYIQKQPSRFTQQFIGDNLQDVLIKSDKILLSNPWHILAIQKQGSQWCFYDPNHPSGPILCDNTEALIKSIQNSLGTLISVATLTPDVYIDCQTEIKNIPLFIKNGGLLSLHTLSQAQLIQVISSIKNKTILEPELLDGLSYYSNSEKAVWELLDLSFCRSILNTYHRVQCDSALAKILTKMQERVEQEHQKSISTNNLIPTSGALPLSAAPVTSFAGGGSSLTPETKAPSTVVSNAEKAKQENTKAFQTYEQIVQPIEHFYSSISKTLSTWERTEKETPQDARRFIFNLLSEEKTLVRTPDEAKILELRIGIQQVAQSVSRPVYYVDKAEDLQIILKRFRVNTDGNVSIETGSPLSDFLQSAGSPKTILINYDHFSTEEIIQFNEILDKEPKVNGQPLPEGIRIIGLQNASREDAYQESDFYSRFTQIRDFSSDSSEFKEVFSIKPCSNEETALPIELYHDPAWKAILFGQLRINGREFIFVPGALSPPTLPSSLMLKNAPVDDPEFMEFWRQAIVTGKINLYGREYIVPVDFQLLHDNGYDLETFSRALMDNKTPPQHVLNSQSLNLFLGGQIIQNGEVIYREGLIKKGAPLSILLTEELSKGQWAKLLQACPPTIQIQSLPDTSIPDALKARIETYTPSLSMTVVQTNDIERYLHEKGPGGLIIDVSDFDTSEVFGFTKALLQEDGTYRFESRDSWLIKKLERGEKVVLKGHFSERLIQGIAQHILLNPELGQHLALIGDLGSHLKRFSSIEPIIFDAPRKLTEEQEQSLSLLTHPELKLSVKDQSAEEFTRERIISIQTALQSNPFVFITGLSGCGKTTFIKKHLKPYLEKQGIEEWLKSDSVPCYLFFDEANLSHDNGLMFEGLLQKPPFIIFEGQYRDVPITHRVIFAGNPVTYGDERKIPKLLSQHPHVIVFDPIPPRALKEDILLPLFENTPLQGQANEISDVIIELYAVILSYSTNGVLISPRELQSIAMLTIANADHKDPVSLAKHYAFTIGRQIVPAKHVQAFEDAFKVDRPLPPPNTTKEFLITPSRAQTAQYLRDLLQLRTYRRTQENQLSNAQKTVGLGGFILEGEPGIGKSELLIEVLHHEFGLCKASSESHLHQDDVFYILPPSISLDERKALLLKAFHEGAVVIVDEMNSGPMLESFLNALLMGATPDGVPAARPGFTVLATQNPSSRGGRREQSEALLRRMLKFNLENYSKPEIQNILLAKGIEKPLASVLAGIFEERLRFAKEQGKKPEPSFRDLMRLVDNLKEHKVTLSIENVQSLNHHLKKLIELGFSSDEINQLIDTLPANAASEISEPEQLLSFLRGLLSSEMKSTVLKWCVEHKKLSPFLVEEILNIPALSVLLPLSITSTITEWSKSDVVLETLTFKTFILSDLAQLNKLTHISDENFQACCQHYTDQYFENDHGLEEFMGFCNSPIRAKMLAQVISDPKEFHAILSMFNHKQVEETIITSFIQNLGTKLFYFEQILEDLTLIESLPPEQALACLDLSYKPSLHNFSTLLSRINKQHLEYFLNWYIDKKHEINNHIFTEILQHPKLLQKIQNMSPGDFNSWIPINQDNRDLPFNAFILRLTILRGLNKSDKDVVDWINAIKLDDLSLDRVQLSKLFSKEFETTFSPIMKSTIFSKLFKSKRINDKLTDLKEDEDVYKLMLDSSALLQSRFGMLINHKTDHPHQKHLINKLRTSIIEKSMKEEILKRAPQWRLSLLEELCREPSSREYLFKSKNYLKEMRKIHQKMESVKDDEDANQPHLLHLQKLNDTQAFLMDILNYANDHQKSNSDRFINEITEKTAQLVNQYQDPRIYHYVLNFMLLIFPPLLIFNLARKFLYNENVFYNEDNALTRAAKTMSDEIIKPSGRKT